jgi:hypothetical protein
LDNPVQSRRHPTDGGVLDVALDVDHAATGIALVPETVQLLGRGPKLDDQVA